MTKHSASPLLLTLALLVFPVSLSAYGEDEHHHGHGGNSEPPAHEAHEPKRGPHGGRLFEEGAFSLEVTIFEQGVEPEYRLFPFLDGHPVSPNEVSAEISLVRFARKGEVFGFEPSGEFLRSQRVVEEPHSFEVTVEARFRNTNYSWRFESFEGRTVLSDDALKVAQIETAAAGPTAILNSTTVYGRILADEDRVAHLGARFPGVVREIRKSFGDTVQKGDVLAIIESNQNLQPYELRVQIGGVVIQRHAVIGEVTTDGQPLFIVADLSRVWADFHVYRDDIGAITVGQPVRIELGNGKAPIEATVAYVSPVTDEATQSKLIRAVLPNPRGDLRPGLFVSGTLIASATNVAVAVRREAIQTFRDWNVVYLTDGHTFQAAPVTLGRSDPQFIEVLSGIEPGDSYVAKNSFIIKADVEKSAASHDH